MLSSRTGSVPGSAAAAPGRRDSGSPLTLAAAAALSYAAVRAAGLAAAALLLRHGRFRGLHLSLAHLIVSWDSGRYLAIAAHWYAYQPGYRYPDSILAWFPGYPMAIDAIAWIPGGGPRHAGFAVTIAAGLAAAAGLARLGMTLTGDRRLSLVTVAAWAAAPGSIVLAMAYSEALFCALAVWSLAALAERRWLAAAGLAAGAGLVRGAGVAVAAAVIAAALPAVIAAWRQRQPAAAWWRPAAAAALSPAGVAGYWAYTAARTGHLGGWLRLERDGGQGFDWGQGVADSLRTAVFGRPFPALVLTLAVLAVAALLTLCSLAERFPLSMHVYTVAVVVIALGSGPLYLGSKPRFLLPAVLLAVPAARLLAPLPAWLLGPVIAVLAAASVWFSLVLMTAGWAP
ncbi:MAG TPA: hypothetical protein VKV35_02760 [Streptosporangiaceae bacterium]|nr:hypothetical protein [Streptosporangiaceae bacterium]